MDTCNRFGNLRHEILRLILRCLVIVVLLFLIVNNGNILTDSTDERNISEENTMICRIIKQINIF